jgi:phage N-6-adenine-methyltransferase
VNPGTSKAAADRKGKADAPMKHGISIRNFWMTPIAVFDALDEEFKFSLDAAAERESALCLLWLGPEHHDESKRDALQMPEGSWAVFARSLSPSNDRVAVFLNPPYSPDGGGLARWVERAWKESRAGVDVVLLLPGSVDTGWMEFAWRRADEVRFTPRIAFIDPLGGGRSNPTGGSAVVVFRPSVPVEGWPGGARVRFGYHPWD